MEEYKTILAGISALVSGSLTGYGTNYYAVKMLFKKYGPWGGVILKTRPEFTQSVSELVERDIINKQTIEKELNKYEFRKVFYKMIEDLLKTQL